MALFHPTQSRLRLAIRNSVVAVLVSLLAWMAQSSEWGQAKVDEAFDDFSRGEAEAAVDDPAFVAVQQSDGKGLPWTVIAFDEQTYAWAPGGTAWTPRSWLVSAIDRAVRGGAAVVLVDFWLTQDLPVYQHPLPAAGSATLVDEQSDWTEGLARLAPAAAQSRSVLLFADSSDPRRPTGPSSYTSSVRQAAQASPSVVTGAATFLVDPRDRVTRRFQTYVNQAQGRSPSLVVQAVLFQAYGLEEGRRQIAELSRQLSDNAMLDHGFDWPVRGLSRPLRFERNEPDEDCVSARLRLRLLPDEVLGALSPHEAGLRRLADRAPQLIRSFDPLAEPSADELRRNYAGKIVLIGATDWRLGDVHRTSVGDLPGVLVHANSIDTLQRGLQPMSSAWSNIVTILVLSLLLGIAFAWLPPLFATKLVLSGLAVLGAWGASVFFRHSGVFINIWAPIASMAVLELLFETEEWWRERASR